MTVQELIEKLKGYPSDMSVVVYDHPYSEPSSLRYRGYRTYEDFSSPETITLKRSKMLIKNVNGEYIKEEIDGKYLDADDNAPNSFTAVLLV